MESNLLSTTNEEFVSFCQNNRSHGTRIVKFSDTVVIKFGMDVTASEASNQHFVWKHADHKVFHVPEVYRFFQDYSLGPPLVFGYLVMEYINGTDLSSYLETATTGEQDIVVDRLLSALDHLETIPCPNGQGPGPVGGGCPRGYLWSDSGIHVSFNSTEALNVWLNARIANFQPDVQPDRLDFTSSPLVICHTDLAPRNISRLSDGRLALLDWANAGFYPRVFEIYAFRTRVDREPIFTKILERLPNEGHYEREIQLLAKVESVMLRFGDSINSINKNRRLGVDAKQASTAPPPPRPNEFAR